MTNSGAPSRRARCCPRSVTPVKVPGASPPLPALRSRSSLTDATIPSARGLRTSSTLPGRFSLTRRVNVGGLRCQWGWTGEASSPVSWWWRACTKSSSKLEPNTRYGKEWCRLFCTLYGCPFHAARIIMLCCLLPHGFPELQVHCQIGDQTFAPDRHRAVHNALMGRTLCPHRYDQIGILETNGNRDGTRRELCSTGFQLFEKFLQTLKLGFSSEKFQDMVRRGVKGVIAC